MRRDSGSSLLELTVSLAILIIVTGAVVSSMTSSAETQELSSRIARGEQAVRLAVLDVSKEVAQADRDTFLITVENGANRIDFVIPTGFDGLEPTWSSTISFFCRDDALIRSQDGVEVVVCRNLPAGGFRAARNGNSIDLGLVQDSSGRGDRAIESRVQISVALRNRSVL